MARLVILIEKNVPYPFHIEMAGVGFDHYASRSQEEGAVTIVTLDELESTYSNEGIISTHTNTGEYIDTYG